MAAEMSHTYQLDVTQDADGCVFAALIRQDADGQWGWLSDHEFGPFDTLLDLCQWMCRKLRLHEAGLMC